MERMKHTTAYLLPDVAFRDRRGGGEEESPPPTAGSKSISADAIKRKK
jgi:hypothetical protein